MYTRKASTKLLFAVLLMGIVLPGCATLGDKSEGPDATGYYAGNWYGPNPEKPLGDLTCTITPGETGNWDALFFATFGGVGEYEVDLEGTTQGDAIVFQGSVDLGETSGGVFDWNGTIVGDQFNGTYTSKFINGTFKMDKTTEPDAG